jgi:hypothetical protein
MRNKSTVKLFKLLLNCLYELFPFLTFSIPVKGSSGAWQGVPFLLLCNNADATSQDFHRQSHFMKNSFHHIAAFIASIMIGRSQSVDTRLHLPSSWNMPGIMETTCIFRAKAAS